MIFEFRVVSSQMGLKTMTKEKCRADQIGLQLHAGLAPTDGA